MSICWLIKTTFTCLWLFNKHFFWYFIGKTIKISKSLDSKNLKKNWVWSFANHKDNLLMFYLIDLFGFCKWFSTVFISFTQNWEWKTMISFTKGQNNLSKLHTSGNQSLFLTITERELDESHLSSLSKHLLLSYNLKWVTFKKSIRKHWQPCGRHRCLDEDVTLDQIFNSLLSDDLMMFCEHRWHQKKLFLSD